MSITGNSSVIMAGSSQVRADETVREVDTMIVETLVELVRLDNFAKSEQR